MKKQILTLVLLLITSLTYSQSEVDSLIDLGVKYANDGRYNSAIRMYKKALKIEHKSPLANIKIATAYMYAEEYEKSIKHCDKVLKINDEYLVNAYVVKGSSLDYLGKTKKSIKLFEKAIKKYDKEYLLYYNLAFNYYKEQEYDKSIESSKSAILINPNHASSHLLLGYLMADKNKKVQSLLSLHYYLYLEPDGSRSKTTYELLQKLSGGNVKKDKDKPTQINITVDVDDSEFSAASMMISLLEASSTLEENEDKSEEELFISKTKSFFSILGELKKDSSEGIYWDLYVPFFYDIAKSDHIDTYCYYISQSSNEKAVEWLLENKEKIKAFGDWLKEEEE